MRSLFCCLVGVLVLAGLVPADVRAIVLISDDFEDAAVNMNLWAYGGREVSWSSNYQGSWSWSHDEIAGADGYLCTRVQGPPSVGTYGAAAWVSSRYDFNDGRYYLVNFTWQADVANSDPHNNSFFVQVTDGYMAPFDVYSNEFYNQLAYLADPVGQPYVEGTMDLYRSVSSVGSPGRGVRLTADSAKQTWSIMLGAAGTARLYNGPNATGSLLREEVLNPEKEWHVRFMVADATSSGFPSGDSRFNLHDFQVTLEPPPQPRGDAIPLSRNDPADLIVRSDPVLDVESLVSQTSATGEVHVAGPTIEMTSGSPAWIRLELPIVDPVNSLMLDADFTSQFGAEGLLSLYWDDQVLGVIDERFASGGMDEYLVFLPEMVNAGVHSLALRLDPWTDDPSTVVIDNIRTAYAVPEPSALALLGMGVAGLLVYSRTKRRRR